MSAMINVNVWNDLLNNLTGSYDEFYATLGQDVNLYQFDIVSGFINVSERGEDDIIANAENDRTNIKVQTSNEPIVCYWEGSFETSLTDDPTKLKKNFSVGKYYKTKLTSVNVNTEQGTIQWNENDYNSFAVNRTINLFIPQEDLNDVDLSKKIFLILNKRAKSKQWLKITNVVPIYNPNDENKLVGSQITLMNLNLQFSKNGRDILTMVQLAQPGGNYAFPKEVQLLGGTDIVVQVDTLYLYGLPGTTNVQLEFTCGNGLSDIVLYGRVKNSEYITAPKRLLLNKPFLPKTSALNVVGSSTNNYFAVMGAKSVNNALWKSWKDNVSQLFNFVADKTFNGGIDIKKWDDVFATNAINTLTGQYTYSSFNNWKITQTTDLIYTNNENALVKSLFNLKDCGQMGVNDFLNHNGFLFQTMEYLPTDYTETTRWSLKDIPILGGIGNAINTILGFDPAWQKSINWVSGKPINFIIPCETAQMGKQVMGGTANYFPYDILSNDNNRFRATGNFSQISAYNFSLTDRFQTTNPDYIISSNPEGKGGNGIWDTIYLGMFLDENGVPLFSDSKYLLWHEQCKAIDPLKEHNEYEIDTIHYQQLGKCDCRMTFFNNYGSSSNLTTIYETRQITNAKAKSDCCLWTNFQRLNYYNKENNKLTLPYPYHIDPPLPEGQVVELKEFKDQRLFLEKVWKKGVNANKEKNYIENYEVALNKEKGMFGYSNDLTDLENLGSNIHYQANLINYGIANLEKLKDFFKEIQIDITWKLNDGGSIGQFITIDTNEISENEKTTRLIKDGSGRTINFQLFNNLPTLTNVDSKDRYYTNISQKAAMGETPFQFHNYWDIIQTKDQDLECVGLSCLFSHRIIDNTIINFNFLGNIIFLSLMKTTLASGSFFYTIEDKVGELKILNNFYDQILYGDHKIRSVKLIPR